MSPEDASECLNVESADFAHQAEEGLWDQKSLQSLYLHWLEGEGAPWAVSSTSAPPAANCDLAFYCNRASPHDTTSLTALQLCHGIPGIPADPAFAQTEGIKPMGLGQALL